MKLRKFMRIPQAAVEIDDSGVKVVNDLNRRAGLRKENASAYCE